MRLTVVSINRDVRRYRRPVAWCPHKATTLAQTAKTFTGMNDPGETARFLEATVGIWARFKPELAASDEGATKGPAVRGAQPCGAKNPVAISDGHIVGSKWPRMGPVSALLSLGR